MTVKVLNNVHIQIMEYTFIECDIVKYTHYVLSIFKVIHMSWVPVLLKEERTKLGRITIGINGIPYDYYKI